MDEEIAVVRSGEEAAALPPDTKVVKGDGLGDDDLAAFAALPNLETLYLDGCFEIGDEGLRMLGALPSLRVLYLSAHRATDDGLVALSALPNLVELGLDTLCTGDGFVYLSGLPSLKQLHLPGWPNLNPDHFHYLAALPSLEKVAFYGVAAITPEVGVRLAETLPRVDIEVH